MTECEKADTAGNILEFVNLVVGWGAFAPVPLVRRQSTIAGKHGHDPFQADLCTWVLVVVEEWFRVPFVTLKEPVDLTVGSSCDPWERMAGHPLDLVNL
mgnify:CR=1 FL=1